MAIFKRGSVHFRVKLTDIIRFEADESYTHIYTLKDKFTYSYHLGHFESLVATSRLFVRVHDSHLINYDKVESYEKGGYAMLEGGHKVPISDAGYSRLVARIEKDEEEE